ncbi:MAG TPA: DNA topoisomerase IV subunit A [Rectinemataceae bacterium]|nr:DNA topoisomerase IV subunit A [Rectinemataceae bacterium]
MAYVKKLFDENFLYYASYVIKDRAIPDVEDGLKPVQRRIMHTLFEADDGKFHKVANIVGSAMKYHPHGDASIYSALVVLANKELFIDRQGNFGNLFTGDEASAARYIECRASPLAKDVFHNPKITDWVDSYDGRNREPELFPAKLPVILIIGAEGIAVGMSTKILPHNPLEVIQAEIACLRGKKFNLLPDFPTGGIIDASEYADGMGKVRVRAKLDLSDPKRIVIREIPFGTTTESLIESIESAARAGRIKVAAINDFTTETAEIEIRLQRGVYAEEVVDSLYAFTECEVSISCNLLVIKEGQPVLMRASDILRHHAARLVDILTRELKIEEGELKDEIHARTLERIFIEERVYKAIETKKTQEAVQKAVIDGLAPFQKEIKREVTLEDVERLLKIPIRRISLYDIEKARAELQRLSARLKEVRAHLASIVDYAVAWLEGIAKKLGHDWKRKTEIARFGKVDVREVAKRDIVIRYDRQSGYLGSSVSTGESLFSISSFEKVLVIRRSGMWSVVPAPDRLFVDKDMLYSGIADKETLSDIVFTIVYREAENGYPCIKRFRIEGWIMNKDYQLLPEGAQTLWFTASSSAHLTLKYVKKPKVKIHEEKFKIENFDVKGIKANGVRLASRQVTEVEGIAKDEEPRARARPAADPELFAEEGDEGQGKTRAKPKPKLPGATRPAAKGGLLARAEKLAHSEPAAKKKVGVSVKKAPAKKAPAKKAPAKTAPTKKSRAKKTR